LIAVRPRAPFGLAQRLERTRASTISAAKTVRNWFHK
jgi:hypothetical protein